MKSWKTILILSTAISFAAGFFANAVPAPENGNLRPPEAGLIPANAQVAFDGIYRFEEAALLVPKAEYFGGKRFVDQEAHSISFSKNEPVAIEVLRSGDVRIRLLVSEEQREEIPEAIVISAEDFDKSGLVHVEYGNYKDLTERYSDIEETQEARRGGGFRVGRGRTHYRNAVGGAYYGCLGWVCARIGICSGRIGGGRGMTSFLRARGWRSVSCSNPPVGAIASWSGGPRGSGHTAMWNGSGWCYDQGCHDPGRGYHLLNCVAR